ncbi:hypothetical protein BGZ73_005641, partial [Actinomortierella ambigua]
MARPLLQRLRLVVASDAIYLCEHSPDRKEQAADATPTLTAASEGTPSKQTQSSDHSPSRRALRIAYSQQLDPIDTNENETEGTKASQRVALLVDGQLDGGLQQAKEYVVYGCIGLLDLYMGPYLVVVSAVEDLGRVEDKAVFSIKKVAIVPLNHDGACEILDKQGLGYDPLLEVAHPLSSLGEDSLSPLPMSSSSSATLTPVTETAQEGTPSAPKVKFALFPDLRKHEGRQHQRRNEASSNNKPILTISPMTGDHAETMADQGAHSVSSSPPQSPRSPTSGFFSKFKLNFMSHEDEDRDLQQSSEASLLSSSSQQKPPATSETTPKSRRSFDGFRNGRFAFGVNNKAPTIDKNGTSQQGLTVSSAATSIALEMPTDQGLASSSSTINGVSDSKDHTAIEQITNDHPPAAPVTMKSSASGLDAAEAFISSAARQLGNWSEEVVSGLLPLDSKTEAEQEAELELERNQSWDRKIIREISSFFSSGFYFSYDFNLLLSMQKRSELSKSGLMPIWKQVDRRFWWNEHLQTELVEIDADEFILPIMQGFVEIEQCEIEGQAFEFVVISRRSRERSGLRYQRRGIDTDGHAANFVETEQLLRIVRDDSDHQVSFVQIRGSIPLFWSQSPYNLKPIPIMERTAEENEAGFRLHFDDLLSRYGRQILVNLVEQHGREMIAGSAYTRYANKLNESQIKLIQKLETSIQELGYCWQTSSLTSEASLVRPSQPQFHILHTQKGAIRTNCMDCLDRTNVVQSALARHVLNQQLLRLGISSFPEHGLSVYEQFESIFNHVWANNGDAISRAYAGTSALKGDFTRTGKRNWQGMVNDATNSIARMYQNTFKDSFRQAAIDYMLGIVDVSVFKNLQTTAFGTAVVPAPILPPLVPTPSVTGLTEADVLASISLPPLSPPVSPKVEPVGEDHPPQVVATTTTTTATPTAESNLTIVAEADGGAHWVDNMPTDENATAAAAAAAAITASSSFENPDQVWAKIREAAIETAAEIVISPGENNWRGWTLLCCSNEVGSILPSASEEASAAKDSQNRSKFWRETSEGSTASSTSSSSAESDIFYDEKVVLLTDRALYICTYDYGMEKVLEFWRLALEKLTAIDKGTFIISTATPRDVDPVDNYGFAVVYRASVQGETLRVNTGSVRNRRAMTGPPGNGGATLEPLIEEEHHEQLSSHPADGDVQKRTSVEKSLEKKPTEKQDATARGEGSNSKVADEEAGVRQVRFKIVQHPETKYLPFV